MPCVRDGSGKPGAMRNEMKHGKGLKRTARPLRSLGYAMNIFSIKLVRLLPCGNSLTFSVTQRLAGVAFLPYFSTYTVCTPHFITFFYIERFVEWFKVAQRTIASPFLRGVRICLD